MLDRLEALPGPQRDARDNPLASIPGVLPFPEGVLVGESALRWPGIRRKGRRVMLWGHSQQCETLDELLADVRAGRSRVLAVRDAAVRWRNGRAERGPACPLPGPPP